MTDLSAAIPGIPLDVSTAQRLVRLLGMLGSAHDGEVANAGRMADRLIREHGLTWPQVIAPTPPATFTPLSREPATALEWRQLAAWIKRNFADLLNAREHRFVTHMATWRSMPSPKQKEWLTAIAERFEEVAA
jgi:hypothetical protein